MNIASVRNCYGCGVCATVCSRELISIRVNENGFYEPFMENPERCVGCGLCVSVCAYSHEEPCVQPSSIHAYVAWSKDAEVRRQCSSGGVAFEFGRTLLEQGYKVCGVRYNVEKRRAEHYIATTEEELRASMGSKYIQSYTVDGFRAINRKEKYLVIGSPCQMDSFRRYIRRYKCEDNFVLMDFYCHGVPSRLIWDKYLAWAEARIGTVEYVSWRNKIAKSGCSQNSAANRGYGSEVASWYGNMFLKGTEGQLISSLSGGDMFYRFFLSDTCLGKACYERCKYKYDQSSADIRIGDLWGNVCKQHDEGVNAVVTFTPKGRDWLHASNCFLEEHTLEDVTEGQMKTPPHERQHAQLLTMFRDKSSSIEDAYGVLLTHVRRQQWKERLRHPLRSAVNLIKMIVCR